MTEKREVPDIELRGVSKRYGAFPPVLEGIDLTVRKGEFVSIIGPSGCGKSTILKLVAGLAPVTSGTLLVDGMTPANAREIVSFIFQDPTLLPWRTVAGNVALALELDHAPRDTRQKKIDALLELVGLTRVARSYPRQLSGGMKMRVSIARALASKPRILLMDEPFAALDEMSRNRLNEELLRLREEQEWTVLFVTHSVAEAVYLSNRIIVLASHPGRVAHEIEVDLPFPRDAELRSSAAMDNCTGVVSKALRRAHIL
ncbi:MAG TPA: ABC transporter ATP-binding protein [Silvibacterium sp.]|nr:ABC transporter ATP-binding protein [Silvibacterium sp.]